MVGITQQRSIQDEKLIESIFQSHYSPDSRASNGRVYGATSTNLIIDARPTANAVANTAKGAGTENMDHYKDGKKVYLGIDHIHVMRESLAKVVEALREADNVAMGVTGQLADDTLGPGFLDRQALRRSGWLRHITAILEGSVLIARNVHVSSSHVLIHCSDGWDRTSQLAALSQVLLDPFYRTMRGFQILVEKDWLSFGYKFMDRCGHLSSEKFFLSPTDNLNASGGAEAAQAFLASVQHRFASQHHIKETSPVFHQFLEAVHQVQRQFPNRFEFNQRFLKQLYYHLYSCQFGTFLYNCERERRVGDGGPPPCELTVSVWDLFNLPSEREKNINETYDPSLDDRLSRLPGADQGVLFPNTKDVRFWHELYGRTDEEMNGRIKTAQSKNVDATGATEGVDSESVTPSAVTPSTTPLPLPPSPPGTPSPVLPSPSPAHSSKSPLAASSREMSSSLPDIASNRPRGDTRLTASTSTLSMQSQSPSARTPTPPSRSRTSKQADLRTSSGVMSVWGKLSSNASAAFSVVQDAVQDAYSGVAKDMKGLGVGEGEKTSEMRSRETLRGWGEGEEGTESPATVLPALDLSGNPWATSRTRTLPVSLPFDNPWSSVRALPSRRTNQITGSGDLYDEPRPYPSDPNLPASLLSAEPSRSAVRSEERLSQQANSPLRESVLGGDRPAPLQREESNPLSPVSPTLQHSSNTDPLGVGLL